MIDYIKYKREILALIVRSDYKPDKTGFFTSKKAKQQVGYIVYDKDKDIKPHIHFGMHRSLKGTSEVLLVKKGHVRVDFYTRKKQYLQSRDLFPGDILVLISGGHGFYFYKDSVFLEIKQGPYIGRSEKRSFSPVYIKK